MQYWYYYQLPNTVHKLLSTSYLQNISNSLPAGLAGRRVPGLSEFWGWDNQDPDIRTHMFTPCGAPYRYLHRSTPQKLLTSSLYFSCVMRVQRNVVEGMLRGNSWYGGARELFPRERVSGSIEICPQLWMDETALWNTNPSLISRFIV